MYGRAGAIPAQERVMYGRAGAIPAQERGMYGGTRRYFSKRRGCTAVRSDIFRKEGGVRRYGAIFFEKKGVYGGTERFRSPGFESARTRHDSAFYKAPGSRAIAITTS